MTRVPNEMVRSRTCNNPSELSRCAMASDSKSVGANGEDRVQGDDPDNAGNNRGGCGAANIRGAAAGIQSDLTPHQRHERAEGDTFKKADRELLHRDGATQLLQEKCWCHIGVCDADE